MRSRLTAGLLVAFALSGCASGVVSSAQYQPNSPHDGLAMKTPLLNPNDADAWIKPYRADNNMYVRIKSNAVYVTDGWYVVEYACIKSLPKKTKTVRLTAGYLGYVFMCTPGVADIDISQATSNPDYVRSLDEIKVLN